MLRSGPVLAAFFKVSCPTCQLTLPYLSRLSGGGLRVVGISQDDAASTAAFNSRFGVSFETLVDSRGEGYPASNHYGITHVPSLFVIEQDGTVSAAWNGFSKKDMEKLGERAGRSVFEAGDDVPAWKPG